LILTALFLVFAEVGIFSVLDRNAYDLGVRFSADKEPYEDIAVVAIDDKSLKALGTWPWTRDVLAEITLLLGKAKSSVIGFNLPLDGAQNQSARSSLAELRAILKKENKLNTRVNRALRVTETALRGDDKLAASFKGSGRIDAFIIDSYAAFRFAEGECRQRQPRFRMADATGDACR